MSGLRYCGALGWFHTVIGMLARVVRSRVFGYCVLLGLLVKALWGIWDAKDFTGGDTCIYYANMVRKWIEHGQIVPGWSPLYQMYFGVVRWVGSDVFFAAWAHRVGIVICVTVLLYEIGRRLVSPWVALGVAAWWVVLPINHNSLYEVHIFGLILPLVAVFVLVSRDSSWRRGTAVAILFSAIFLVRQEYLVATVALLSVGLVYDIRRGRRRGSRSYIAAYLAPLALAGVLVGLVATRSSMPWGDLGKHFHAKRKLNTNQLYAFGYQQRHPEWKLSPWTDCDGLMTRIFGSDDISLAGMFVANPSAMIEHVAWNFRMLPDGTSLSLFNARAGPINPDYAASEQNPGRVIALGTMLVCLIGAAAIRCYLFWPTVRGCFTRPVMWGLAGFICLAATSLSVLLLAPPRPAFIAGGTMLVMILAGVAVEVLVVGDSPGRERAWAAGAAPAFVLLACLTPWFWKAKRPYQPILAQIHALEPHRERIKLGDFLPMAASAFPDAVHGYLELDSSCPASAIRDLRDYANVANGENMHEQMLDAGIRSVVIVDILEKDGGVAQFEQTAQETGWMKVGASIHNHHSVRIYALADGKPSL